jgi:uncharacterized repeat protein (TIGR03803 family)
MDGDEPSGSLARDLNGNLFGTTASGGGSTACTGGCGTIFKVDPTGKETILHSFNGTDGSNPFSLILDASGNLYGVTLFGGEPCPGFGTCGVVFKLDTSGNLTILHNFTGGADGANPEASLVMDTEGNLYGTTLAGGASSGCPNQTPPGCGIIFEIDKNGIETIFGFDGAGGNNPSAGLLLDSDGSLYGTATAGGAFTSSVFDFACGCGTVFKVDNKGKETVLHSFTGLIPDNGVPYAQLIEDQAGILYGTTEYHPPGSNIFGTVFKLNKKGGPVTELFSFDYGDGGYPLAGLTLDSAGNLYGTTSTAGPSGAGTVFELSPVGQLTTLHSFNRKADGGFPQSVLVLDNAGNLYGTTPQGGSGGGGIVFKITP